MLGVLQGIPFLQRNGSAQNGFNLPDQHAELRNGVFRIGRDGLLVLAQDQKLVARAGIGTVEAPGAEFAEELAPFKWSPRGRFEPCSNQFQ